jgi:hypothetical protein
MRDDGNRIVVRFEGVGDKTLLLLRAVAVRDLLPAAP